jgi:DtxR family transcriptional regulator, Mn-dependent transcriptional regulator
LTVVPVDTSSAVQDYLKGLCLLEDELDGGFESPQVSTTTLAQRMGVSAASATNMLKRLDALGLVAYVPYQGAGLTHAGREVALEVIRHHRLLETYLAEALGVPWDQVHKEAEVLEHVLSEELEERISAHLGHPSVDPHGHPIPAADLTMPPTAQTRLWDTADGTAVAIEWVPDVEAEALRYMAGLGLRPGVTVEVVERGPVGGPLFVRIGGAPEVRALSKELAEDIWVA